jgi:hypothetical protein
VASDAQFTVTNPEARRRVVAEDIKRTAEEIAAEAESLTPRVTGRMAGSYEVQQGNDPATSFVSNDTPYARFVEYGTKYMRAEAPLGRAVARHRG